MSPDGDLNNPAELNGLNAYDSDGSKIGNVGQVYFDDRTGRPEWVTVKTGMFGMKESLVPLSGTHRSGEGLHLPYDKETVKEAPRLDADEHLDPAQEKQLYQYYGLTRGAGTGKTDMAKGTGTGGIAAGRADMTGTGAEGRTGTGPVSAGTSGAAVGARSRMTGAHEHEELIRSEEQLHVSTEEQEVGTARLRKIVVTENVTTTVPVSHEEVRVVHEPIAADDHTADRSMIGEAETEVILHAEQPVVRKEAIAVERVRMEKEKVTEQREVSADVRKEQIEYDSGVGEKGPGGRRGPRH